MNCDWLFIFLVNCDKDIIFIVKRDQIIHLS